MATPNIRTALDTFQQAANRGTAVHLSPGLVQELRDALKAEPEGEGPALDHASLISFAFGREPWATWLRKGGCLESAHCELSDLMLAAIVRWDRPTTPPSLEAPAEALAARLLLEQVAAMADCIGAQTVGQITAISNRAAAWLRENPLGQPVAIEPRCCPTPAPEPGEVPSDELMEQWKEECKRLSLESDYAIPASSFMAQRVAAWARQQQATELAALREAPVAGISDEHRDAVCTAIAEALGNAYDCQRTWSAWSCGTMGPDDFTLTAEDDDRVAEIADAAIEAFRSFQVPAPQAGDPSTITTQP